MPHMDIQQANSLEYILTFIAGGGLVTLFTMIVQRRKISAEADLAEANADSVVISSALQILKEMRVEAADLKVRALEQEKRASLLAQKVLILEDHVKLQMQIILDLRKALAGYNPEHDLLKIVIPMNTL